MTPTTCTTTHNPPHSYGDCLRACVATILDLPAEDVPHFADRGISASDTLAHCRAWLKQRGLTMATFGFPGTEPLDELMQFMERTNPGVVWLLFGSTDPTEPDAMHVNVCRGGEVLHDPAWVPTSIKAPYREGGVSVWQIWVIVRV